MAKGSRKPDPMQDMMSGGMPMMPGKPPKKVAPKKPGKKPGRKK